MLNGQTYFNYRFDFHGTSGIWDGGVSTLELTDGYVICGGTGSSINNPWHQIAFMKVDFEGNRIFSKIYGDTIYDRYLGNPGCVFRINDTLILGVGSKNFYTQDTVYQYGLVLWLNSDFDTAFSKIYGDYIYPHDTNYILYNGAKTLTGQNLIFTGIKYKYDFPTKAVLIKTTLTGDRLWEKSYVYGTYYYGHSLICTSDGGYAIGGYVWTPDPPPNYYGDPIIIKTDSLGNQKWVQYLGSVYPDGIAMLTSSTDSMIVAGFCYTDSLDGGNFLRRIRIVKLNNNGDIVWDKKYGHAELDKWLWNIRTNPDGTFIATGYTSRIYPGAYQYVGWIMKIGNNGDSLWYREYNILKGEESPNYLYDAIQTNDNGYLACGMVYPVVPDTGSQDGWALKVDSIGCESPGNCWVGINEDKENTLNIDDFFIIYPNPASNIATIEFSPGLQPQMVEVADLYGRRSIIPWSSAREGSIKINISSIPDGMYVIRIIGANSTVLPGKILVNH